MSSLAVNPTFPLFKVDNFKPLQGLRGIVATFLSPLEIRTIWIFINKLSLDTIASDKYLQSLSFADQWAVSNIETNQIIFLEQYYKGISPESRCPTDLISRWIPYHKGPDRSDPRAYLVLEVHCYKMKKFIKVEVAYKSYAKVFFDASQSVKRLMAGGYKDQLNQYKYDQAKKEQEEIAESKRRAAASLANLWV